tara:strand:+ start:192 stop:641 length:450 start_codon:yes stop_codon:yes gene_type:complete
MQSDMSLHSASWSVHCSAVDDISLIEESLQWLAGEEAEYSRERSKSHHGAPQLSLSASIIRKKAAKQAFSRLGTEVLEALQTTGIESLIDDDKTLHVRLDIDELVRGRVILATGSARKFAAKGRFKIEAYPGQEPVEIVNELIATFKDD